MFNFFKKTEKEPKNLDEVLKELRLLRKSNSLLSQELKKLQGESQLHFKKFGFIRYNPFPGVGSDQSFSLTLLTNRNDGIIITSLFSREGNRVYAKTVEAGGSSYALSDEEKKVLQEAIEGKKDG
jgi:hypothetical protein